MNRPLDKVKRPHRRFQEGGLLHHQLSGRLAIEVQDAIHKVSQFILELGNLYATDDVVNLITLYRVN